MKRYNKIRKRFRRFLCRYINGTKGVISLFLAILMLPFVSVGGALINAARVDSAIAIFDEALCNASNSTLGTYDSFLRTRFGLLAMSQDTSSHGGGYTAQDLISDTFEFYMKQNAAALSNTYVEMETDAAGIYPLADTSVLLSEVLEYGKYAIPTKLVIDGLCINDIIDSLSGNSGLISGLLDTASSGLDTVNQFDECQEKFDALSDRLKEYVTAKGQYEEAYSGFETAVSTYNDLVDERAEKIKECNQAVADAEGDVSDAEESLEGEDESRNQAAYSQAQNDLADAERALADANSRLEAVIQEYQGKLDAQRAAVESSKSAYIIQINAFAAVVKAAGEAVGEAQDAYMALEKAGTDLVVNFTGTVCELRTQSMENQVKDIEKTQKEAAERGDTESVNACAAQIAEANTNKDAVETANTLFSAGTDGMTAGSETLSRFVKEGYTEKFNQIYTDLTGLGGSVAGYTVESGYETKMADTGAYYKSETTEPLSGDELEDMLKELLASIVESAFFAVVKAVIGFIKAIAKIDNLFDPELCAVIDPGLFPGGQLPSGKDPGRLVSAYEAEDSRKSEYYKQLLSSYSTGGAMPGDGMGADSLIEKIRADIEALAECFKGDGWSWTNLFSQLGKLVKAVTGLVKNLVFFVANAVVLLEKVVGQKILLTGYVAYNIPNRTTYTGSALTGSSYQLPGMGSSGQGYAFYGAEAEYIMKGSTSEIMNQTLVFANILLIRILYDIGFVITNQEIATLAQGAGAVTFGIGMVLIYVAFIVGEAYVDTLILVNGGTVPIWKGTVYLSPSGIPDLIEAFYKLPLGEDVKKELSDQAQAVSDSAGGGGGSGGVGNDIVEALTFDYTKTILFAMLFENKEKMLNRLADVIQMEASYQAASGIGRYAFDIDQSYTYLRASGSFRMNEFLPISDRAGLRSRERVIYRGY